MKSTEKIVATIPAKDAWEEIEDWDDIPDIMGVLDNFDPATLPYEDLREFASRNPYETDYYRNEYGTPVQPIEHRLDMAEWRANREREDLETLNKQFLEAVSGYLHGYDEDALMAKTYKKVRQQLIKAVGVKSAAYVVRTEFESRTQDEWDAIANMYHNYETIMKEKYEKARQDEEESRIYYWEDQPPASVHEKIVKIRKGLKASNGKPLVQRDFAKLLEYPVNKFVAAEKTDRYGLGEEETPVEDVLLEKLVMIAYANPYWLFDPFCEAFMAHENSDDDAVQMGDEPCVYATPDVILKWIREGKPRETKWEDGVIWDTKQYWL